MTLLDNLTWVIAASALAPFIARAVPGGLLPSVVIEIGLGTALGPYGLGWVTRDTTVDAVAQLGFAALMLVAGIEVGARRPSSDPDAPRPASDGTVLAFTAMTIAIAFAAAWLVWRAERSLGELVFMGLVLSTTSVGAVVPTIKEHMLARTAWGQTVLACALAADFVTMIAVSMVAAVFTAGSWQAGLVTIGYVAAGGAIVWVLRARFGADLAARIDRVTWRSGTRVALALLLVLAWIGRYAYAELVLAAFLVGIGIGALTSDRSYVRHDIESIGFGLLIPVCFVSVGVSFDLNALAVALAKGWLIPALLAFALLAKLAPAILLVPRFGPRMAAAAGMLLSARLSLIIAASLIGQRIGIIDAQTHAVMTFLAVVTSIACPIGFLWLARGELGERSR